MRNLNETAVLNYYLELIDKEEINFLKGRPQYTADVRNAVIALRDADGMNNRINAAKDMWKLLFEAAMSHIDPDKRGYDKLFSYFDEYVNFEELIFASDSFYRDHTLHSLWVYFLGEYIFMHEEFRELLADMDVFKKGISEHRKIMEEIDMPEIFGSIIKIYKEIEKLSELDDSMRCINAITHDLGYPIKKIEKINKCIKGVLPFFSINNYDEFNFSYSEIQQNFISSFIEFLSSGIILESDEEDDVQYTDIIAKAFDLSSTGQIISIKKDEIAKLNKDELISLKKVIELKPRIEKNMSRHWAYSRDFEEYKHGIMSAFLLVKNVSAFHDIKFVYFDNLTINYNKINIIDVMAKQSILRSITNHTNENFKIRQVAELSDYLTLIDELEEFSRISRANQNREYITEFCTTDIYMENGWFNIDFTFENDDIANLDPQRAFKGRCQRFLNLFDIKNLSERLKIRLRCIGKLPGDENVYTLELAKKYAKIMINEEEKSIPKYLNSKQLYTREEYQQM